MKQCTVMNFFFSIFAVLLFAGCAAQQPEIPEGAALVVIGQVENEIGWLEEDIQSMESIDVESNNSKGETDTYTGVLIKNLLDLAGVKPDATAIVFVADDGSSVETELDEIHNCEHCIVSFRTNGGFSIVAPGLGKELQIKGVVTIELK